MCIRDRWTLGSNDNGNYIRAEAEGTGSGLGKEMSRHFLKHGSEVVICGRRESVLEDTVK